MMTLRPAHERGRSQTGWLDSYHTFSFGHYQDAKYQGFRSLLVINDDRVAPGGGFAPHSHRDMEIVSIVLSGALEHKDSLGNGSIIKPGDVQRMSAGTGIQHSEFNPSSMEPVHFLQIWIVPEQTGLPPGYEQKSFPLADRRGRFQRVASRDGDEGSVSLNQQADLYLTSLQQGESAQHEWPPTRGVWLQIAEGSATVNSVILQAGDGLALQDESKLEVQATSDAQLLLFELA